MRLLIITLLFSFTCQGQIINASGNYRIRAVAASGYTYILDSLTTDTAQTAYSFRKLREGYSGSCIRVRESGGNTEQDINFVNNYIDTASMKTFVGANSGYVVTIYDQTTNARDVTNATAGEQPRIINAGAVEYDNGHVAARWLGAGYKLSTTAYTAYPDSMTSNFVMRVVTNVTYNASVSKSNNTPASGFPRPLDQYNNVFVTANSSTLFKMHTMSQTFNSANGGAVWSIKATATSASNRARAWENSSNIYSSTSGYYYDASASLYIGSRSDGATGFNGYFFEAITFTAITETELIDGLHANQMSYYGY